MKAKIAVIAIAILFSIPISKAYVDAKFIILDENGRQIFMRDENGEIIYGNVVVGQKIYFDGRKTTSHYGNLDSITFNWFFGDYKNGIEQKILDGGPLVEHVYEEPGIYTARLVAKGSGGPAGITNVDIVEHEIIVVEKLIPPVVSFDIVKSENTGTYSFMSRSYDPDGYIKIYRWDCDGDGKWDAKEFDGKINWTYNENGIYVIKLNVVDWDNQENESIRVLKIKELNGNINEIHRNITIINACNTSTNVSILINNCDIYNFTLDKKAILQLSFSPDWNEIKITSNLGHNDTFVFNKELATIYLKHNGEVKLQFLNEGIPGFESGFMIVILFLIALYRRRK